MGLLSQMSSQEWRWKKPGMSGDPRGKPRSIDGLKSGMLRKWTAIPIEDAAQIAIVVDLYMHSILSLSHYINSFSFVKVFSDNIRIIILF